MSFPSSPTNGQQYTSASGTRYVYNSTIPAWLVDAGSGAAASSISFTATGDIAATNVQAALAELDIEKLPKAAGTWQSTTNAMTLVKNSRYILGAGHTVTLPNDCAVGEGVAITPDNGDWGTLGATVDTAAGITISNTVSSQNATAYFVLVAANTFKVFV